jgi:hypothetical protein
LRPPLHLPLLEFMRLSSHRHHILGCDTGAFIRHVRSSSHDALCFCLAADTASLARSETHPAFLASVVARWPLSFAFLLLLLMIGVAVPAGLPGVRPIMNNDFESLLLRDHPSAAMDYATNTVSEFGNFWDQPQAAARRRRLLAVPEFGLDSEWRARLGADSDAPGVLGRGLAAARRALRDDTPALHAAAAQGRALLQQAAVGEAGGRTCARPSRRMLNLFYRWSDNSTAITDEMVVKVSATLPGLSVATTCHALTDV